LERLPLENQACQREQDGVDKKSLLRHFSHRYMRFDIAPKTSKLRFARKRGSEMRETHVFALRTRATIS
jgi:hypothetical protein